MNAAHSHTSQPPRESRMKTVIFFLLMAVFFISIHQYFFNLGWHSYQYAYLSQSFMQGELAFSDEYAELVGGWDMTYYDGKYYWPLGPLPSVILMPVVGAIEDTSFPLRASHSITSIFFAMIAAFASYKIARKVGYSQNDSIFWTIAFCIGSTFVGVATFDSSWYLAHTIGVTFVLLALLEYLGKRRPWLIGILMGLVLATRITAGFGIIFFGLAYLFGEGTPMQKAKKIGLLLLPFMVAGLLLASYNLARYDSLTFTGYETQHLPDDGVIDNRAHKGLFSLEHIPRNIYFEFLNIPTIREIVTSTGEELTLFVYDPRGMSLFVTTPWLLAAFFLAYRKAIQWQLLATSGFIAGVLLLWHSSGCVQFGSRFLLDFLPFVILAFMMAYYDAHKRMSKKLKAVIILAVLVNTYLLFTSVLYSLTNTICSE